MPDSHDGMEAEDKDEDDGGDEVGEAVGSTQSFKQSPRWWLA